MSRKWCSPIMLLDFLVWGNLYLVTAQGSATLMDLQRSHTGKFYIIIWNHESQTQVLTEVRKVIQHNMCVCVCVRVHALSHVTLCDPMDCSPPGSSVRGISQARILEWENGCHFLLQGIFPTQRSNLDFLCLLQWWVDSLLLIQRS